MRIGILASHGGSNLQAVVDATKSGLIPAEVVVVISNNPGSGALARAAAEGIPFHYLSGRTHSDPHDLDGAIAGVLSEAGVDLVLLAGYMKKVGPRTLGRFPRRILNIHPSLLPRYGGAGMYGMRVHESVLESGDPATGVTVHLVDDEYDRGPIVSQRRVPVHAGEDAQALAARVLAQEHALYVDTVGRIVAGELDLDTLS